MVLVILIIDSRLARLPERFVLVEVRFVDVILVRNVLPGFEVVVGWLFEQSVVVG